MPQCILEGTLMFLRQTSSSAVPIAEVHLSRYFTIVELADGNVGACMSSFHLPNSVLAAVENALKQQIGANAFDVLDRDLLGNLLSSTVIDGRQRCLVAAAVMTAITSALSATVIRQGGDALFTVSHTSPRFADGVRSALVIGFGGYVQHLAELSSIRHLHIADLSYGRRREEIDCEITRYVSRFPEKRITVSQTVPGAEVRDYETICITGSALGNGTLDGLLTGIDLKVTVVLQGQSASIHPIKLFEAGVSWVETTVKPAVLSSLAKEDYDGSSYRAILEGGLPWLYLLPHGENFKP